MSVRRTLFAAALAGLTALTISVLPDVVKAAAGPNTLTVDVACDCRTGSPAFFKGNRGDAWIVTGKIFPAGTLPSGTASNDPTEGVNGISPIGTWTCPGVRVRVGTARLVLSSSELRKHAR